ncbi:MAG: hypothetical protein ACRD0K_29940 [Egibacteraceae bacterium]
MPLTPASISNGQAPSVRGGLQATGTGPLLLDATAFLATDGHRCPPASTAFQHGRHPDRPPRDRPSVGPAYRIRRLAFP